MVQYSVLLQCTSVVTTNVTYSSPLYKFESGRQMGVVVPLEAQYFCLSYATLAILLALIRHITDQTNIPYDNSGQSILTDVRIMYSQAPQFGRQVPTNFFLSHLKSDWKLSIMNDEVSQINEFETRDWRLRTLTWKISLGGLRDFLFCFIRRSAYFR